MAASKKQVEKLVKALSKSNERVTATLAKAQEASANLTADLQALSDLLNTEDAVKEAEPVAVVVATEESAKRGRKAKAK